MIKIKTIDIVAAVLWKEELKKLFGGEFQLLVDERGRAFAKQGDKMFCPVNQKVEKK